MLLARHGERTFKIRLRFRSILLGGLERDFPGNAMEIGFTPVSGSSQVPRSRADGASLVEGAHSQKNTRRSFCVFGGKPSTHGAEGPSIR